MELNNNDVTKSGRTLEEELGQSGEHTYDESGASESRKSETGAGSGRSSGFHLVENSPPKQ